MKKYGFNKATEFSKKELAPLYKAAKNGELKVERLVMSRLYELADYYGYDSNHSIELEERDILQILRLTDTKEIQDAINLYTEKNFKLFSKKAQEKFDRRIVE